MTDPSPHGVHVLSPACVVSLTARGLGIPVYGKARALPLDFSELQLLVELKQDADRGLEEAIAAAVGQVGGSAADLAKFSAELDARGLLCPSGDVDPGGRGAPVEPADGATSPSGSGGPPAGELCLVLPIVLQVASSGFDIRDHDGRLISRLSTVELVAISEFVQQVGMNDALERHQQTLGERALEPGGFHALIAHLARHAIIVPAENPVERERIGRIERRTKIHGARIAKLAESGSRARAAHRERRKECGDERTAVVPVVGINPMPVLALGMVTAYALAHDGGSLGERYEFYLPGTVQLFPQGVDQSQLANLGSSPVFLFSDYFWSVEENMALSERLKDLFPDCLTIHGGPDVPKYESDIAAFFERHTHVDVIVHGEGEVTLAEALQALSTPDGRPYELAPLADVAGLSFRYDGRVFTTPDRERIADLDALPSPYLSGVFDIYRDTAPLFITIETNRGCPYGCTFCDWGSATRSRIRKFSLDRVFAELEWCAKNKVENVMVADANFGIFPRDVEIATKVAELKEEYGYPRAFGTNYAKNTIKHLRPIVQVLVDAGILTEGLLSLQSMDADTLRTIERSNIKLEKYEELLTEFRRAKLPLLVDLMMGLPGSTLESFKNDLQACVDRDVTAKIHSTVVLTNSPMNEPSYRQKHRIQVNEENSRGSVLEPPTIVAAATFTREDYQEMEQLRLMFFLAENFGILRQVTRYVRHETGLPEVELLHRLRGDATRKRERWPTLSLLTEVVPHLMVPPGSWRLLIDELHDYCVQELGVRDDSALSTVLEVQHSLMPAYGRRFPVILELPHDYAKWHELVLEAKDSGDPQGWIDSVQPLRTLGPATFSVNDPKGLCGHGLGFRAEYEPYADWELESPVARPMPSKNEI